MERMRLSIYDSVSSVYLDIWVKPMIEKMDCPNLWAVLTSESLGS